MKQTITIKRMEGSSKELSSFKKGKRFDTLDEANTELWCWSQTVPEGEHHRVAYEVSGVGDSVYGTVFLSRKGPNERVTELVKDLAYWYPDVLLKL